MVENPATVEETVVENHVAVEETTVENAIIHVIREKPGATTKDFMQKTGLSRRGVEYHLAKMKNKKIRHEGSTKGGYWVIL